MRLFAALSCTLLLAAAAYGVNSNARPVSCAWPEQCGVYTKCVTLEAATGADIDIPVFAMREESTILANGCIVNGVSATAQITDGGGAALDGVQTCGTGSLITWDTDITQPYMAIRDTIELDVITASTVSWLMFCFQYTDNY